MSEQHRTPIEAVAIHGSGRVRIAPSFEAVAIPLIDTRFSTPDRDPMFARLDGPALREFARSVGARLPTAAQFIAISDVAAKRGCELKPCKLPTREMRRAFENVNGPCPSDAHPKEQRAWLERLYAPMASFAWCEKHDSLVWAQLRPLLDRAGPFSNIGKPEIRRATERDGAVPSDMLLAGWREAGQWVQGPNENPDHGAGHTDYSKVAVIVWDTTSKVVSDAPKPSAPPGAGDDGLFVPAERTHATVKMVYDALRAAWPRVFSTEPDEDALRILVAMSANETGTWKSLWNWNLGNVKRIREQRWTMLDNVWEMIDGVKQVFHPPHAQTHFSAYSSLEEAAPAWMAKMEHQWGKAWAHALAGDAVAFSKALKKANYYSQIEEIYTRELVARVAGLDDEMFDVQAALAKLGYSDVRAFQKAHPPLKVDGIAGPKTKAALREALAKAA